jgi:hypothetical protein
MWRLSQKLGLELTWIVMPTCQSLAVKHTYLQTLARLGTYPYTPEYKPMQVQMVDVAVKYESPLDGKVYILVIRNALYVPSNGDSYLSAASTI